MAKLSSGGVLILLSVGDETTDARPTCGGGGSKWDAQTPTCDY